NFRQWDNVSSSTNGMGQVTYKTNRFTELATGMHHLVGTNWVQSTNNIVVTTNGGAGTNTAHQVAFAANINTYGAIQLTAPDGNFFKSHIIALAYFDSSANTNVLFAMPQDRIGSIQGSNQVI